MAIKTTQDLKYWDGSDWVSLKGPQGESAFQTWLSLPGNGGGSMQQFIAALQGPAGNDGTGVNILGSYPTEAALIAAQPSGQVGDAWLVNGDLYVWSANTGAWDNVGTISGPKGDKGDPGASAFELWLAQPGNTGLIDDFLLSLVGETGAPGADGVTGNAAVIVGTVSGQATPLPGGNWLSNTDFESGSTLGWVASVPANCDLSTGAPGVEGSASSLIVTQKTATGFAVQTSDAFPVRGGQWVEFTAWVMLDRVTASGNVNMNVRFISYNSSGGQIAGASVPGFSGSAFAVSGTTKQWVKVSHRWQVTTGQDVHSVRAQVQSIPLLAVGDKTHVDRASLKIGDVPLAGQSWIVGDPVPNAVSALGDVEPGDGLSFDGSGWLLTGPLRGPVGERGPAGDRGEQGPAGADGPDGVQGVPGDAATVTVGSTVTSAPGGSASVSNSGSTAAAVLNFTIPRGQPGPQGDPGEDGMDGESPVEVFAQASEPTASAGKELSFWLVP